MYEKSTNILRMQEQENKILIYFHQESDQVDLYKRKFTIFIKHPLSMT